MQPRNGQRPGGRKDLGKQADEVEHTNVMWPERRKQAAGGTGAGRVGWAAEHRDQTAASNQGTRAEWTGAESM